MGKNEWMERNLSDKRKLILPAVVIVVLLAVILAMFFKGYISAKEKSNQEIAELKAEIERLSDQAAVYEMASKEISYDVISEQIQEIAELTTQEYMYTDAGKFSDPKQLFGYDIPFTTKSFVAKWDGSIKAGIDTEKITVEVDDESKEIVIHMPKAEILSHEIVAESIETLDEKDGLFNPVKVEDVREFDKECKAAMEKRAIENGILQKAEECARDIIYKLVNTEVVQEQEYSIVFEQVEE